MAIWLIVVVWLVGLALFVAVRAHVTKTRFSSTLENERAPTAQIARKHGASHQLQASPHQRQRKAA